MQTNEIILYTIIVFIVGLIWESYIAIDDEFFNDENEEQL